MSGAPSHPTEEGHDVQFNNVDRFMASHEDNEDPCDPEIFKNFVFHMTKWQEVDDFQQTKDIAYVIDVTNKGKHLWTVKRTFTEFKWLEDEVRGKIKDLPPFPGEKRFGKFNPRFLETRKILLRQWIQACTHPNNLHRVLATRSFMEISENARHQVPTSHSGINKRAVAVVQAIEDFDDGEPEHLCFKRADLISIVDKSSDRKWFKGKVGSMIGWLPAAVVKVISDQGGIDPTTSMRRVTITTPSPSNSNDTGTAAIVHTQPGTADAPVQEQDEEFVEAIYNFAPQDGQTNQLSLETGCIIRIITSGAANWWSGSIVQAKDGSRIGQQGYFPNNYVRKCTWKNPEPAISLPMIKKSAVQELESSNPSVQECTANYNYDACEADDLTFKKGDIIEIEDDSDDQWWIGQLDGKRGTFPASYVTKNPARPVTFSAAATAIAATVHMASAATTIPTPIATPADPISFGGAVSAVTACIRLDNQAPPTPIATQAPVAPIAPITHTQPQNFFASAGASMGPEPDPEPIPSEPVLQADSAGEFLGELDDDDIPPPPMEAPPDKPPVMMGEVLYTFVGEGPGEISVSKGEIVTVFEDNGGWTHGENSRGDTGHFPSSFVRLRI